MAETVLRVNGLVKTFERKKTRQTILDGISFSATKNEIIGIMGPSGCGKTTLLKTIGGMISADAGTLSLFGEECKQKMPKSIKRRISYIFQDSNLLPWRSVEENLRLPLEIFGERDEKTNKRLIDEALEIVGLADYRRALPQELSGGMMQRVGIARALVLDAEILLMDQPFGALDALTRKQIRHDFLRIFEERQRTIVIVTNSIDEALLFSHRILLLSEQPATVNQIINVDIPHEKRTKEVALDEQFTEIRKQMIQIISEQYIKESVGGDTA